MCNNNGSTDLTVTALKVIKSIVAIAALQREITKFNLLFVVVCTVLLMNVSTGGAIPHRNRNMRIWGKWACLRNF